jgi:GNAT superfamily N-acetyltransferase
MEFSDFSFREFVISKAQPGDGEIIHELLMELSCYEELVSEFKSTPQDLENILFNLHCGDALLVYDNRSDAVIGVMLISYNFSSFSGKPGIFIEDFYIRQEFRGRGIGSALLMRLKWAAKEQGFGRIDWMCLKRNRSSVEFYKSAGAHCMDDWVQFRFNSDDFDR